MASCSGVRFAANSQYKRGIVFIVANINRDFAHRATPTNDMESHDYPTDRLRYVEGFRREWGEQVFRNPNDEFFRRRVGIDRFDCLRLVRRIFSR